MHKKFEELKQSGALPTPSGVGLVIRTVRSRGYLLEADRTRRTLAREA